MKALAQRDYEVLNELEAVGREHQSFGLSEWARPMDCGGGDGTDHSYRLAKLARHGYAQSKARGGYMARASYVYRITQKGIDALKSWKEGDAT